MARLSTRQRQAFDASGAIPPVGTIIAYAPGYYANGSNNTWTHVGPSANTVTAVNNYLPPNWRVCDGTAPNDPQSPIFNAADRFLPNLTDDRFIMGATAGGNGAGNAGNSKSLSVPELPGHTHPAGTYVANHNHPGIATDTIPSSSSAHAHPGSFASVPSAGSDTPHRHGGGRAHGDLGAGNFGLADIATYRGRALVSNSSSAPYNAAWPAAQSIVGNTSTPHSHPGAAVFVPSTSSGHNHAAVSVPVPTIPISVTGSAGPAGAGDSFSIAPQYIPVFYIMRIK